MMFDIQLTWLSLTRRMQIIIQALIALILLLFLAAYTHAQESEFGSARHAVGFSGGSAMGPGITYRIYTPRSFYQGTIFARVTSRDDITDFMLGAAYGRILSEISIVKALPPTALIIIAGIDARYSKDEFVDNINDEETDDEKSVHTGVGIALEIGNTFSPGLLFTLGTTYALSIEQQNGKREWNLGPQANVGLLYNW